MQMSGTIKQIVADGGFQSQHGYLYAFQMTIECPEGLCTGQINSKSPTYPATIGQPITVEMENGQHGVKFTKLNPQYPQPTQQAPQQAPQQAQQQAQQPRQATNQPQPSKDRLIPSQVVYKTLGDKFGNPNEFDKWLMGNLAVYKRHLDTIMQAAADTLPVINPFKTAYQANPDYVGEDPPPPVDDFPF